METDKSWAERMRDEDVSDEEAQPQAKKAKTELVSEETREVVQKAFTTTLTNAARKETCSRAPYLELPFTRCPKLDSLLRTSELRFNINTDAKQADTDLQKVQALMLDVAAPLLELMDGGRRGCQTSPGGLRGRHHSPWECCWADVKNPT